MVFVGFGFLMTFLRRYSVGAVALNMVVSAQVFLQSILIIGYIEQMGFGQNPGQGRIIVDIPLLINSSFCAAGCMIAFGAVIGKTTPTQTVMLAMAQVPLHALNLHIVVNYCKALDMGGTLVRLAIGPP